MESLRVVVARDLIMKVATCSLWSRWTLFDYCHLGCGFHKFDCRIWSLSQIQSLALDLIMTVNSGNWLTTALFNLYYLSVGEKEDGLLVFYFGFEGIIISESALGNWDCSREIRVFLVTWITSTGSTLNFWARFVFIWSTFGYPIKSFEMLFLRIEGGYYAGRKPRLVLSFIADWQLFLTSFFSRH